MSIQSEIINTEVRTTGAKAVQDDILRVNQAIKDLAAEEKNLIFIKNKLESQGKKNTEEWKKNETALKSNREATARNREELTKLNSQMKISEMTYNQLSKRAQELRGKLNNISKELQPEKWNRYNKELNETSVQMQKVRSGSTQTNSTFGKLSKAAGLLGIGLGSVWGVLKVGKSIIDSTDDSADKFEETVGGMRGAWEYFKTSMATGDFSNFFRNMRDAIGAGREFAKVMDELGDRQRSYQMMNADEITRGKELELIWRDRRKSEAERKKALEDWQDLQGRAAKRESEINTANYKEQLNQISGIKDIRKEDLEAALRDFSKYKTEFEQLSKSGVFSNFKSNAQVMGEEKALDSNLLFKDGQWQKLNENQKKVLLMFKDLGLVAEDDRTKLVELYTTMRKSEAAVLDAKLSTLRVENQIDNAAEKSVETQEERDEKITKSAFKRAGEILKSMEGLSGKVQQIEQDDAEFIKLMEETKERYRREGKEAELKAMQDFEEERQQFLLDYQELSSEELKEQEIKKLTERRDAILENDRITAEQRIKIQEAFQSKLDEINQTWGENTLEYTKRTIAGMEAIYSSGYNIVQGLQEIEITNLETNYDKKIEMAGNNKAEVTRLEEEKEKKIKATRKKYADTAFALQVSQITASTAQSAIEAYKSLVGIPYVGPVLAAAAAAVAIAYGGMQIASANAQRQKAKSLYTGGYTGDGGKFEPAGTVHKGEYVVSSDELRIPEIRNYIGSVVEPIRMRRLGYSEQAQSTKMPSSSGYAQGGFVGNGSTTDILSNLQSTLDRQNNAIEQQNKLLSSLRVEGVNANFDETKIKEIRDRVSKQQYMESRATK